MRVVAITPDYPPRSRVGAWLATHAYLAQLAARGHEVSVNALLSRHGPCVLDGVEVRPSIEGRDDAVASCDVVIGHLGGDASAARLAAAHGKPLVQFAHGRDVPAWSLTDHGGPDLVVACSHTLRGEIGWDGPTIIARPITSTPARVVLGDRITLVNCAESKGIRTLHRVAARLEHHQFLAVAGGYGEQLGARTKNTLTRPTVADMSTVWKQTRILLMPSEWESWGMTGVEALAHGIPVIAHPCDGLRESLGDGATFVDRDDTGGWVEALLRLDDPDEWAAASHRARARFAELDFSPDIAGFVAAIEAMEGREHAVSDRVA